MNEDEGSKATVLELVVVERLETTIAAGDTMAIDILQEFLNRRFFNIGDADDTRFDKLRKAADQLAASLQSKRQAALNYALVAFDPEVPPDEPIFEEVGSFVQNEWQTYRTCFSDVPRSLFRALLLEALWQAIQKDAGIALAVSLAAKNVLPLRALGNEKDIWLGIVTKAADLAEVQARTDWSVEVKAPSLQFKVPKLSLGASKATTDRDVLTQGLQGAAGPNPHWPNNPQPWAGEFAKKAASAIADAIEKSSKDSSPSQEDIKKHFLEPLTTFLNESTSELVKAIRTVNMSNGGMHRRSQLLWWKEAAYSPSVHKSYKHFRPEEAALLMACDLVDQVPAFCPESVEFFLLESVAGITGNGDSRSVNQAGQVRDILSAIVEKRLPTQLGNGLAKRSGLGTGRKPMVEFLANAYVSQKLDLARLTSEVGISPELPMTPPDFAVWVFREIQASRALTTADS